MQFWDGSLIATRWWILQADRKRDRWKSSTERRNRYATVVKIKGKSKGGGREGGVRKEGIKNTRLAIIFALVPAGCSRKYATLSRTRVYLLYSYIYVKYENISLSFRGNRNGTISPETTFLYYACLICDEMRYRVAYTIEWICGAIIGANFYRCRFDELSNRSWHPCWPAIADPPAFLFSRRKPW